MMNITVDDFWFKKAEKPTKETEREEERFLYFLTCFQDGDFSKKAEFTEFFLNASDWNIFVLGFRLFMAVCSHEDMNLLMDFLGDCEEDRLRVFLAYVPESLSLQTIPYMLALYEDWEDTYMGNDIARYICEMMNQEYQEELEYSVEELAEIFAEFAETHDMSKYYYFGEEYFAGDITKKIITTAFFCKESDRQFFTDEMSSVISNATGIECPVSYGTRISDEVMGKLLAYVKCVAELCQERGKKYFYNHVIE